MFLAKHRDDSNVSSTESDEHVRSIDPHQAANEEHKIIYSILWAKRSSRKHKIWTGDGTLVVTSEKTLHLKDSNGSHLTSSSAKRDDIEEGAQLVFGSYDVQIVQRSQNLVDISTGTGHKRKPYEVADSTKGSEKKLKLVQIESESSKVRGAASLKKNAVSFNSDYEPLVMPQPSAEHQLQFGGGQNVREVMVMGCLARQLRPHQREGVEFLYGCLLGFKHPEYFGCILADEMGLGKTVQCISACYTLLKQGPYGRNVANKIMVRLTPPILKRTFDHSSISDCHAK